LANWFWGGGSARVLNFLFRYFFLGGIPFFLWLFGVFCFFFAHLIFFKFPGGVWGVGFWVGGFVWGVSVLGVNFFPTGGGWGGGI
ncbi:hypothetical protein, partial [Ralstonia sp. Ralssp135]|uniref:hypothetical protein n=1 Tax=Ralstonia sp. Ralssp135 TaxID=3243016 RepID=UPI0039B04AA6